MSVVARAFVCRRCKSRVAFYFNHVGPDCERGVCVGTFYHVLNSLKVAGCADELSHADVRKKS